MAYVDITTRTSADTNSSADINQLNDNIKYLKDISTPISLNMGGVLTTSSGLFKTVNGWTYEWYGPDMIIDKIVGVFKTVDTGGTQSKFKVIVDGTSAQTDYKNDGGTDDNYVNATLSTTPADLIISATDAIEIDFVEGSNADADTLTVFIYCKVA